MGSAHKLLLLLIVGAVVSISLGLIRLLWRGLEASGQRLRWRDLGSSQNDDLTGQRLSVFPRLAFLQPAFHKLLVAIPARLKPTRRLVIQEDTIADPVDGTAFQQGEPIIRCACGAAYHLHSWQWLGQNNAGKCVSCKRAS